jgi:lactoylglutathione lyase
MSKSIPSLPGTKRWLWTSACALAALLGGGAARLSATPPPVLGMRVDVADVDRALPFYTQVAGCELVSRDGAAGATLKNGAVTITLHRVDRPVAVDYPKEVETHINFRVKDMDAALRAMKEAKFDSVGSLEQAAIGSFMAIRDPSGNIHHLMQLKEADPALQKPVVFNIGIKVTDMKKARDFYCNKLGFEIFSEDYYPPTIPLKKSGVVALTLHDNATAARTPRYPDTAQTIVLLGTPDLAASVKELTAKGVEFLEAPQASGGRHAAFKDPFGNVLELVETPPAKPAK